MKPIDVKRNTICSTGLMKKNNVETSSQFDWMDNLKQYILRRCIETKHGNCSINFPQNIELGSMNMVAMRNHATICEFDNKSKYLNREWGWKFFVFFSLVAFLI